MTLAHSFPNLVAVLQPRHSDHMHPPPCSPDVLQSAYIENDSSTGRIASTLSVVIRLITSAESEGLRTGIRCSSTQRQGETELMNTRVGYSQIRY